MLNLQEMAKLGQQNTKIVVSERIPAYIVAPCQMDVSYHIESKDDFYLVHLKVSGALTILCQRCMQEFEIPYDNSTVIAVCRNDERAEQLLEHYECIVSSNWQIVLDDLVVDELHLYPPQFHQDIEDCDSEINQILIR